jgi:hypothetical protein
MNVHELSCKNNCNLLIIGEAINAVRKQRCFYVNRIRGSVAAHENYIYIYFTYHESGYFQAERLWIQVIMKEFTICENVDNCFHRNLIRRQMEVPDVTLLSNVRCYPHY